MRANLSRHSLKQSNRAKNDGRDLLLGMKREKAMKNCENMVKMRIVLRKIARFFRAKEQITHIALFKEQREQFTHGCSFLKSNESDSLSVAIF